MDCELPLFIGIREAVLTWLHQLTSLIQLIARVVMSDRAFMPAAART
jgi:hypothetical protein